MGFRAARARKSRENFSPGAHGVWSTAPNFVRPLRKRVADCKHVSGGQPFLQERIVVEVDLADREIIRGAPVGVDLRQFLARQWPLDAHGRSSSRAARAPASS